MVAKRAEISQEEFHASAFNSSVLIIQKGREPVTLPSEGHFCRHLVWGISV
jgi:hypothetical protein